MAQPPRGTRFPPETRAQLGIVHALAHHLDGDHPIDRRIVRKEQCTHPAVTEPVDDLVAPYGDWIRCHGREPTASAAEAE